MHARHEDDEWLSIDDAVLEVIAGLDAQGGGVEPVAGECFGEVRLSTRRAWSRKALPNGISSTPRTLRDNSWTPT
jgi:hypothetical protein